MALWKLAPCRGAVVSKIDPFRDVTALRLTRVVTRRSITGGRDDVIVSSNHARNRGGPPEPKGPEGPPSGASEALPHRPQEAAMMTVFDFTSPLSLVT